MRYPSKDFSYDVASAWNWSAALKGTFIALALFILLRYLGAGLGVSTGDHLLEEGFAVWSVIAQILCVGVGALVAGYLVRSSLASDGALSGAFTWAVTTVLLTFFFGNAAVQTVSSAVWGTFFGAFLSFAAAIIGGAIGARLHPRSMHGSTVPGTDFVEPPSGGV